MEKETKKRKSGAEKERERKKKKLKEVASKRIAAPAGGTGEQLPPSFQDLAKIQIFRAVTGKYLGKTIIFRTAI